MQEKNYVDVWLRIPDGHEEAEAEANVRVTETGYAVDWYLTAVGLVKTVEFDTLADAYDWLEREGFANFTTEADGLNKVLFAEVMREVQGRSFTLVYVAYDDRLTKDQVAALVRGDGFDDPAWEQYDEWVSEVRFQSVTEVREQVEREVRQRLYREFDNGGPWLDEVELTPEQEDLIEETIRDKDDSDPLSRLISNTGSVAIRVPLGEVPRDEDGEVDVAALAAMLGRPGLIHEGTIRHILAECYDLYLEAFLVAYVRLDESWLFAEPETPVTFETPYLWLGNPFAGNGWCDELPGLSLTVERSQLRTDDDAPGYSWQEVAGPVWSAFASEVSVAQPANAG